MITHIIVEYKDKNKDWRFKIRHRNGRLVANPGEGYKRISAMRKSYMGLIKAFQSNTYKVETK